MTALEYHTLLEGLLILKYELIYSKCEVDLFRVSFILEFPTHLFHFLSPQCKFNLKINHESLPHVYFTSFSIEFK